MWNLQNKIKNKKIKQAKISIIEAEMMVKFYESKKELLEDDKEKAQIDLKISGLKDAIEFNQSFINFFE